MKTMVVTGASTGVGRAIALHFAKKGFRVCALARSKDKLAALAHEETAIRPYSCDVANKKQVKQTFETIVAEHGGIDVLINNAGIVAGPTKDDFESVDPVVDTNLKGTMYCTFAAVPSMRANRDGRIINVASISGVDISPDGNNGLYAASKYGQVAFGESIGKMLRKDGILVTTLCPGGIDTPLWNDTNPYPLGVENMIKPDEIAELIEYILNTPKRLLFKNVIFVPTVEQW